MSRTGFKRNLKPLELLTEAQVQQMHQAILEVLWETGLRIESDWALKFFKQHGCWVDEASLRVRFPAEMVEECVRLAPSSYPVKAPDPANDLLVGQETLYFSHSSGMETIDLATFEPRQPTQAEYIDCVRVLDALPHLDHLGCYPYFGYAGIPSAMAIPEGVALHMKYSTKHQAGCCSNDCEIFTIQLAQAVGHEFTGTIGSSPPLTWGAEALTAAKRIVEAGFPLSTVDGCMMGGTGPATIPGSVVVSSAEQMGMLVLVQLLKPGHRMIVGHFSLPLNMNSGSPAFGQIDASLNNLIFNQMWRYYQVPIGNGSPGYVSAKMIDYQAGYEKGLAGLASALSGVNSMLLHFGVSSELTAHPVQAVLDDDIAGMIGRFVTGEAITAETIAVELIKEVGPIPGHYLGKAHTRQWWQKEQFVPESADRLTYPEWLQQGKKQALDYARARVEAILAEPERTHLISNQEDDIARILQEARAYYQKRAE
ncbi:MAG: methyltransferase [Chloroflexota bacterium]|nr:MAG: methyltransferase [Chloroflexota bacterium]